MAVHLELPAAPADFETPPLAPIPALPLVGGKDMVVLLPRGPSSALVFWELTADATARARASLGPEAPSTLVLRLYANAPGDGEPAVEDHPVTRWLGHRIIEATAGARVAAAVGFRAGERFVHVAASAATLLPMPAPLVPTNVDLVDLGPRPVHGGRR